MRIHTNLTRADLWATLPTGVTANISDKGSRKRERAFEVTLFVFEKDELHRRYGNSGGYGRSDDVAATWDEWGIWIARLFERDPEALIGYYTSPEMFEQETRRYHEHVQAFNKPTSLAARTHTAPWLSDERKYTGTESDYYMGQGC